MTPEPIWNFEQEPRREPGDETSVNLRCYLDRVPDAKMLEYQPDWPDDAVRQWCGDFRDDGNMFLICSEREVEIDEFRREVEACLEYRARIRRMP